MNTDKLNYDAATGELHWKSTGSGRKFGRPVGTLDSYGYLVLRSEGKNYKAHRVAWRIHYGVWPEESLDHINHNKTDNRLVNLREGNSVNNYNRRMPLAKSGVRGAHWNKRMGRYQSSLQIKGKVVHLGYFGCATSAALAYELAKLEVLGGQKVKF